MNERLAPIASRIRDALARLSPRERTLITLLGCLVLVAFAWLFIIQPYQSAKGRLSRRMTALQTDIAEMKALGARIKQLEGEIGSDKKTTEATKNFSLFSFVDKATTGAVGHESIASMKPTTRQVRDDLSETSVELHLSTVSLAELVQLLDTIEGAREPIYIKRLEIKQRYDDDSRFDAVLVAAAVAKT